MLGPDGDLHPPVGNPRMRVKVTYNPEAPEIDFGTIPIYE